MADQDGLTPGSLSRLTVVFTPEDGLLRWDDDTHASPVTLGATGVGRTWQSVSGLGWKDVHGQDEIRYRILGRGRRHRTVTITDRSDHGELRTIAWCRVQHHTD